MNIQIVDKEIDKQIIDIEIETLEEENKIFEKLIKKYIKLIKESKETEIEKFIKFGEELKKLYKGLNSIKIELEEKQQEKLKLTENLEQKKEEEIIKNHEY